MEKVAIIGAGGFAREVLDVIDAINQDRLLFDVLGWVVDPQFGSPGTVINEKPILGGFDWLSKNQSLVKLIIGVGPSHYRFSLARRAMELNCTFISIIHPTAVVTRWVRLGFGVVITAGSILTNNIDIGNHVHINLDCTVGHDVKLKDFVTLAPGVHVSGSVNIEEGAYVGTGANIIEKVRIEEWSIIGAGSTVVKDVPANATVVGVPAQVIKTRDSGWHLQ